MKLTRPLILIALVLVSLTGAGDALAAQLLVRFDADTTHLEQEQLISAVGGTREQTISALDIVAVDVPNAAAALQQLNNAAAVIYAERDGTVRADRAASDPFLGSSSWQLANPRFPAAWDRSTGSASVIVAVLDTGVQTGHEDLGTLVAGYDFFNGDADPADDNGHGTAVAGVINAQGSNGKGVAGTCWSCRVMPIKVLGANGTGSWTAVAAGITWSVDNGADVINMSLSASSATQTVADAVAYAQANDVVVVSSAGNSDTSTLYYPAAYSGVLSVGAIDQNHVRYATANLNVSTAWGSNYGAWVQVVSSGCTNSTWKADSNYPNGTYVYGFCGTSTSSPYVAGLAGLLRSYNTGLSASAVISAIEDTAVPLAGGFSQHGRVDAEAALASVVPPDTAAPETAISSGPASTTTVTSATFVFSANETATFACSLNGAAYTSCSSPKSYSGLAVGPHTFKVRATDSAANTDATPAEHSWTVAAIPVDTAAPETTISSAPASSTSTDVSFVFSADETATFACSLNGAAYTSCSSPKSYSGLAVGPHTFKVRATDSAANTDATPAEHSWTVAAVVAEEVDAGGGSGGSGGSSSGGGSSGGGALPPDLAISATDDRANVPVGAIVTFRVAVTLVNAGSASDLKVTVPLPAGAVLVGSSADRGAGCSTVSTTVVCSLDFLSPNLQANVILYVRFDQAGAAGLGFTTSARQTDPSLANNQVTLTIQVGIPAPPATVPQIPAPPKTSTRPDLAVSLKASRKVVRRGGLVYYTLTVRNKRGQAKNVKATFSLSPQMKVVRAKGCVSSPTSASSKTRAQARVSCQLGTLSAGKTIKLVVVAKALTHGQARASATVATANESHPADNALKLVVRVG